MKIREITLKNFGKYKNHHLAIEFKPGINVVYGVNEAGKSTLFNGILTLLYGFKPANREAHPHLGWGENKIELSGIFEDAEGLFAVDRKLMSSPSGYLTRNEKETKINNKSLDHVKEISKQSYESIYALTLNDVVKMQDVPWSEVEDRLILNYGMDSIKSPREVLLEIEEEMKVLFNPRGQAKNTKVKQLEKEIKELKGQRKETIETQESVLEKEEGLQTLEIALEAALKEEATLAKKVQWWEKHQTIIDLVKQLEGVTEHSNQLCERLGDIPKGVMNYERIAQKTDSHRIAHKALQETLSAIESKLLHLTINEHLCVAHQQQLQAVLKTYQEYEKEMALHLQGKGFVDEKRRQLEHLLSDVLSTVTPHQVSALAAFNLMTIEGKIGRITTLSKDTEALQKEIYVSSHHAKEKSHLFAIGLIGIGAILFGLGLYSNQPMINYVAVLVLSFGGFKFFDTKNQNFTEDIKLYDEKINFNNKKIQEETLFMQKSLAFLNLSQEDIVDNGQRLLMLLKSAKELARDLIEKEETYENKEKALADKENLLNEVLVGFKFEDGLSHPTQLQSTLEEGLKKNQHNERINVDSRNKQQRLETSTEELSSLVEKSVLYQTYLKSVGEGDTLEGLSLLSRVDKLKEKIEFLEEQLMSKDPGHVMQNAIKQIDQNALNEQNIENNQILLREHREIIEGIKLEKRTLLTELEHLLKDVDLFDIESQLLALEDELEEAKEAYDKLLLLKTVVSAYDQDYRDLHQPDIHRRTGAYFNQITKGKYPKVYNDETIGKTALLLRQEGEDREVEGNLSQGARDQLYLALRLAIAEELDKEKAPLPLFLDELFVNWDMTRLEEGLELLKSLSNERQIVVFTCHEWMVDKLKELGSPHIIMLES